MAARRHEQKFGLRPGKPIVIATPAGLVRIHKGEGRNIVVDLPDGMKAHLGDERALSSSAYLKADGSGHVVPKYSDLRPVTDEDGELIGVETVTVTRIPEAAPLRIRRVAIA